MHFSSVVCFIVIFVDFLFLAKCLPTDARKSITIATYNIWNIMFNWDVRKYRIAQMVKESDPDIIVFQEVLEGADRRSQLKELQELLPLYKWEKFENVNYVKPQKNAYRDGWEMEGLGILSKHRIATHALQKLTKNYQFDSNDRVVLYMKTEIPYFGLFFIGIVHLSTDKNQQCQSAVEILKFIDDNGIDKSRLIMAGDFNTYEKFEYPVEILTGGAYQNKIEHELCKSMKDGLGDREAYLKDVWKSMKDGLGDREAYLKDGWKSKPNQKGLTFSNMPVPGLISRPDRILIPTKFETRNSYLLGNGSVYKDLYYQHIVSARFSNMLTAAKDTFLGFKGRSCMYDCGPYASCRCGVCVSGGDTSMCLLPDCKECSAAKYLFSFVTIAVLVFLIGQIILSSLLVLHTMDDRHRKKIQMFFGANCCLCNPELYLKVSSTVKRSPYLRPFPWLKLPPMVLLFVTLVWIGMFSGFLLLIYEDSIVSLFGIIPEEFFPSDHLMVVVEMVRKKETA